MDFEEFNFDDILGEFLDVQPSSEEPEEAPVLQEDSQDFSDEFRFEDEPPQDGAEDRHEDEPEDEEPAEKPAKPARRPASHADRSREEAKAARDAEREAEKRRKIREKKADRRAVEQQRLAAEREREEMREFREQERAKKRAADVDGRRKSRIGLIVFAVVIAAIAAGIVFAADAVYNSGRSMPNLYVGTIPVGRMTREQVSSQLYSNGWNVRTDTPLVISTYGGVNAEINPVSAGALITLDDAVEKTMSFGYTGSRLTTLFNYVEALLKPSDINDAYAEIDNGYIQVCIDDIQHKISDFVGTEPYSVDLKAGQLKAVKGAGILELEPVGLMNEIITSLRSGANELNYTVVSRDPVMPDFASIHTDLAAEPRDAKYTDDGKYDVIDEIVGCDFDVSEAFNIWNSTQISETAVVPLKVTWPSVTGDELRGRLYNDVLGEAVTLYTNSADERINNVNLCASKINGKIIYPGEIFSYNNTVGERTEEAGFKYAPAYSDGEVVEELGGGACQVSSTIYCASLYARLETVERLCHQFEVAYMDQLGLDATVSWPEPDFKFRNNMEYPIRLDVTCDNDERSLTVRIMGTKQDDYSVELKTDKYQFVNENGNWIGWRTLTYRKLYDSNGNLVQVPDANGNMVDYEYTNAIIEATGRPGMDTYMFH